MRQQIVAVAVVLFGVISNAHAGNITYALLDFPSSQLDGDDGTPWHMSGHITTDGSLGLIDINPPVTGSAFVEGELTFSNASHGVVYTCPIESIAGSLQQPGLEATTTTLSVPYGMLIGFGYGGYDGDDISIEYNNFQGDGWAYYTGTIFPWVEAKHRWFQQYWESSKTTALGGIPNGDAWLIATAVPEPSSLALLGIATASLLAYAWRRQRRAA
jgi:hypothetical protein